jgi:hypothetical protein
MSDVERSESYLTLGRLLLYVCWVQRHRDA